MNRNEAIRLGDLAARVIGAARPTAAPIRMPQPCARCSHLAEGADKRGDALIPPVAESESWVGAAGKVYWSGTCAPCADYEWSERWDSAWLGSKGEEAKSALLARAKRWEAEGRRYLGTKRLGGPTTASALHLASCVCADCRAKKAREDEEDRSLFPRGYGP